MKAVQLRMARPPGGVCGSSPKSRHYCQYRDPYQNGADAKQSTMDRLQGALEAAGVEFTNGDQPGVRLTRAAATCSAEAAAASKTSAAAKVVRGQTANAPKKKR